MHISDMQAAPFDLEYNKTIALLSWKPPCRDPVPVVSGNSDFKVRTTIILICDAVALFHCRSVQFFNLASYSSQKNVCSFCIFWSVLADIKIGKQTLYLFLTISVLCSKHWAFSLQFQSYQVHIVETSKNKTYDMILPKKMYDQHPNMTLKQGQRGAEYVVTVRTNTTGARWSEPLTIQIGLFQSPLPAPLLPPQKNVVLSSLAIIAIVHIQELTNWEKCFVWNFTSSYFYTVVVCHTKIWCGPSCGPFQVQILVFFVALL